MNRLFLLILIFAISSCSSVPLSTMARMSTFDARDFAALNPDELRVKVFLPAGFRLNTGASWMGIDVISSSGQHQTVFELREDSVQSIEVSKGLFSEPDQATSYLLRLSPSSRAKFNELQLFVSKATVDDMSIRVVPKLASRPESATSVTVSIELQLSKSQGFFTLVDSAQVALPEVGRSEES